MSHMPLGLMGMGCTYWDDWRSLLIEASVECRRGTIQHTAGVVDDDTLQTALRVSKSLWERWSLPRT